jgi:N-methylhydantoinase B
MDVIASQYVKCAECGKLVIGVAKGGTRDNYLCKDAVCTALARSRADLDASSTREEFDRLRYDRPEPEVDPVMLEVVSGGLISICEEMGVTMARTAYSPIFFEGHDFTCGIFDQTPSLVAQYEGNPAQVGAMKWAVQWAVEEVGLDNISPGDILLHNDPYRGSPHGPEFCMVRPLFVGERLAGFAANIAHHTDVGGMAPGSMPGDSTDVWQEGVIIPPIKLFERDEEVVVAWRILLCNVREPEKMRGDLLAQYGSMVTCERRLNELAGRIGVDTMLEFFGHIIDRTERRLRAEISKWSQGAYEGIAYLDDDGIRGTPIAIRATIHVWGQDLVIDLRGSDPQGLGPVNAPYGVAASAVLNAVLNVADPTIPRNEGVFRPLHVLTRAGTIVNVDYPAPLNSGNTETHNLIVASVMSALSKVVPHRVAADDGGTCSIFSGGGLDPKTGRSFSFLIWSPCGAGGRSDLDGNNAMNTFCGSTAESYSAEVLEACYPVMITNYSLIEDSGGQGRRRGGLGIRESYRFAVPHMTVGITSNRAVVRPQGFLGGGEGRGTRFLTEHGGRHLTLQEYAGLASPTKGSRIGISAGQEVTVETPGGGGYGTPGEREPDKIEQDLRDGYISRETAVNVYCLSEESADQIIDTYWFRPDDDTDSGRSD